ncbi:MAG: aminopeptidase N [Actinomycetota bacterium]
MPSRPASSIRENLTRDEAELRSRQMEVRITRVHLDLTGGTEHFVATSQISFTIREPGAVFLDCTAAAVDSIELDGVALDPAIATPTRVPLPSLDVGEHTIRIDATMAYRHEGNGLHRFVDPADDRVYLHSQFEPFDAHLVYPCFDQPDLKTVFELEVEAPEEWVVVSNGAVDHQPPDGAGGTWRFAPTERLSTYVTAVVAGSYTGVEDSYVRDDGSSIALGLHVRRSLAVHLDAVELFEITRQSFAAFERIFEQRYPFGDRYDQLFVPEFSAGAMENPGCVTFSEAYVFRSRVTDAIRERRAETIIHEMAHMWFGDLVTMRWWDDLWLNESFATFMAVFVQASATRWSDAWVTFTDAEKSWATFQDELPSTHPVADAMPDVESVHQNFDGITYAKGASVLRQLVAWVGQDEFFAGCRDYFSRHAFSNTTLADFLAALERASGRDLGPWRDEWLRTTGLNHLEVDLELADDGTFARGEVVQADPPPSWAGLPGIAVADPVLRRHRLAVGLYRRTDSGLERDERIEFDVTGERTPIPGITAIPAAEVVLVNDDDLTYAKARLDPASTLLLTSELSTVVSPLARAQLWAAAWEMVRDGELAASRYVELVRSNVPSEGNVGPLQRLLGRAVLAAERYADPDHADELLARQAEEARNRLASAPAGGDHQLAWARHWATVARATPDQLADVGHLLDGELKIDGLELDRDLRWHLLVCRARAGVEGEDRIAAELALDPTDIGARNAATARAAQPHGAAKEAAWRRLLEDTSLSHTVSRHLWSGFLQLEQGDVLKPYTARYFDALSGIWETRSLDWSIGFSSAMFPHADSGPALLERVDVHLGFVELPRPLRRVLLEQRDVLVRTLAARALDASVGGKG